MTRMRSLSCLLILSLVMASVYAPLHGVNHLFDPPNTHLHSAIKQLKTEHLGRSAQWVKPLLAIHSAEHVLEDHLEHLCDLCLTLSNLQGLPSERISVSPPLLLVALTQPPHPSHLFNYAYRYQSRAPPNA